MAQNFVVLGLGTFGYQVAIELEQGGGQVLAIDNSDSVVQHISSQVTKAAIADIRNEEALRSLDVYEADTVIVAMPDYFDITVLVTHHLKEAGVKNIICQVETEPEAGAIQAVGAKRVILPERDMARTLSQQLLTPDLGYQIPLGESSGIIEVKCPSPWEGKTLTELDVRKNFEVHIIGIRSNDPAKDELGKFSIPSSDIPLDVEDVLFVLGNSDQLIKFKEKFDLEIN